MKGRAAVLVLVAVGVGGCGSAPESSTAATSVVTCQPPPFPSPAPPGPDKQDIEFRAASGFRADIAYIDAVKRSPTANHTWGVALTSEEASELVFRGDVLGPFLNSSQVREYEAKNAATFGGDYVDQVGGGILTFLFTRSDPRYLADLAAMIPYPSRVAVRVVRHTKAELDAVQARITQQARGSSTIYGIGVWVPRNVVTVSVGLCDEASLAPLQGPPADELLVYPGTPGTTSAHGSAMPTLAAVTRPR